MGWKFYLKTFVFYVKNENGGNNNLFLNNIQVFTQKSIAIIVLTTLLQKLSHVWTQKENVSFVTVYLLHQRKLVDSCQPLWFIFWLFCGGPKKNANFVFSFLLLLLTISKVNSRDRCHLVQTAFGVSDGSFDRSSVSCCLLGRK